MCNPAIETRELSCGICFIWWNENKQKICSGGVVGCICAVVNRTHGMESFSWWGIRERQDLMRWTSADWKEQIDGIEGKVGLLESQKIRRKNLLYFHVVLVFFIEAMNNVYMEGKHGRKDQFIMLHMSVLLTSLAGHACRVCQQWEREKERGRRAGVVRVSHTRKRRTCIFFFFFGDRLLSMSDKLAKWQVQLSRIEAKVS